MGFAELFLIGVGLSMDAFAVSICKGLSMKKIDYRYALVIAAFFGGFQALMPLIGWALGSQFEHFITPIDHWIAFVLLAFIGGKMLLDAIRGGEAEAEAEGSAAGDSADGSESGGRSKIDYKELLMLAVATSIDALAVGITFAFLGVNIWVAIAVIGVTTFVISFFGVVVGNQFGSRFEKPATIVGGVVLILIGLKVLLEHLGIISF